MSPLTCMLHSERTNEWYNMANKRKKSTHHKNEGNTDFTHHVSMSVTNSTHKGTPGQSRMAEGTNFVCLRCIFSKYFVYHTDKWILTTGTKRDGNK